MAKKAKSEVKSSNLALLKLKKRKLKERAFVELIESQRTSESGYHEAVKPLKEKKPKKADKEKKNRKLALNTKRKKRTNNGANDEDQLSHKDVNDVDGKKSNNRVTNSCYSGTLSAISDIEEPMDANIETKTISKKRKKDGKIKRKDLDTTKGREMEERPNKPDAKVEQILSVNEDISVKKKEKSKKYGKKRTKDLSTTREMKSEEKHSEVSMEEVDQIMSVDEDCSRGMRKWLIEYKESRPGLKILQQRNDDFIAAYEAQQEQERIEREARVAEGGWTVVTHHKGRKKSTDTESGISVGSVAQASVMDKVAKKKSKEVGLDFYRFQRREAQRNDVMKLQSKFEQDKKRIQQLRAARKFRPY